jgi:hypothetical protein
MEEVRWTGDKCEERKRGEVFVDERCPKDTLFPRGKKRDLKMKKETRSQTIVVSIELCPRVRGVRGKTWISGRMDVGIEADKKKSKSQRTTGTARKRSLFSHCFIE